MEIEYYSLTGRQEIPVKELWEISECFPDGLDGKEPGCKAGDPGSIPGLGRSPGEGNGNSVQYSCLEIPWTEEPGGLQSTGSQRVERAE